MPRTLTDVEQTLGAEALRVREEAADREAAVFDAVLSRVSSGMSRSAALREALPGCKLESQIRRLRTYEAGGRDALVSRRYGPPAPLKMTPEVKGGLRVLAKSDPSAGSEALAARLSAMFDISVQATAVQKALQELGLSRPRGRRWPRKAVSASEADVPVVEALVLAGAELLKAVDEDVGAVAALTAAMGGRLDALPAPEGPVQDDRGDRDGLGRFLPTYNQPGTRTEPELGARFNTVASRRAAKDLRAMRVADESAATRHRKNLGLVLLPCVVRSARWSELEHWRGDQLGELVGYAYQPSTLDKYLRELKLAGCAEASREALASSWLSQEGQVVDETTGAVVVYADASTKPLWTHHWTRATKVSKTGRVQPAVTTVSLHSGAGTPLVYRSYSGHASLRGQIGDFLAEYERHAGEGTVRRVVVMDREAHSVALFKDLAPSWGFVIPLRGQVVGSSAKFEDVEAWSPYGPGPDEVCNAKLSLNDNRPGEDALVIRVVGRRRHRSGKVAWFATPLPVEEFSANDIIRLYFERWPAQEHVYRDGSGAVGLDVHHGYGKSKVDNVAVIDTQDRLLGQVRRLDAHLAKHRAKLAELAEERAPFQRALDSAEAKIWHTRGEFEAALAAGTVPAGHRELRMWEDWLVATHAKVDDCTLQEAKVQKLATVAAATRERKLAEVERLSTQRRIFTVDVELDEIMMAFKLTFMNLCHVLMTRYLAVEMEVETLIDAVLTLPGERVTTRDSETIRIYRQPRDVRAMAAVERACAKLTGAGLRRGDRALAFEVVDAPSHRGRVDPNEPRGRA